MSLFKNGKLVNLTKLYPQKRYNIDLDGKVSVPIQLSLSINDLKQINDFIKNSYQNQQEIRQSEIQFANTVETARRHMWLSIAKTGQQKWQDSQQLISHVKTLFEAGKDIKTTTESIDQQYIERNNQQRTELQASISKVQVALKQEEEQLQNTKNLEFLKENLEAQQKILEQKIERLKTRLEDKHEILEKSEKKKLDLILELETIHQKSIKKMLELRQKNLAKWGFKKDQRIDVQWLD